MYQVLSFTAGFKPKRYTYFFFPYTYMKDAAIVKERDSRSIVNCKKRRTRKQKSKLI
jgi:hypothetical protein